MNLCDFFREYFKKGSNIILSLCLCYQIEKSYWLHKITNQVLLMHIKYDWLVWRHPQTSISNYSLPFGMALIWDHSKYLQKQAIQCSTQAKAWGVNKLL